MRSKQDQLTALKAEIAKLDKKAKQLGARRRKLEQAISVDSVVKLGIKKGLYCKAIPTENAGDVFVGKVLRILPAQYGYGPRIPLLVPAKGRFMERTVFVDLKRYDLERVSPPQKEKKK